MRRAVGLLFGVVVVTAACFTYGPAPLTPESGMRVRMYLTAPTTVTTYRADTPMIRAPRDGIIGVDGVVLASIGDTLLVEVHRLIRGGAAVQELAAGQLARIPVTRVGQVEAQRFAAGRTALLGVVAFGVGMTVYLTYVVAMMLSW